MRKFSMYFPCFFALATLTSLQSEARGANKAKVDLIASATETTPAVPLELGVRFKLDRGWHMYWKNPGDAGQAPRMAWKLPEGFSVGDLEFPIPTIHLEPGGLVTNIYEDEVVLLAKLTPPAAIANSKVTVSGEVRYLICKEACIPETANVKLELRVDRSEKSPTPAHADVFASARRALPLTASKHVDVSASISTGKLTASQDFDLQLQLSVKPGIHLQSHAPLSPNFIKTQVVLERIPNVFSKPAVYPPGQLRPMKVLGQVSEYSGVVTIKIPSSVGDEVPSLPLRVAGLLYYQACNDQGICFPPETAAFQSLAGDPTASIGEGSNSTLPPGASSETGQMADGSAANRPDQGPLGLANSGGKSYLDWLILAFLGGLILNLMPCVLPVISIKVLSLVQQAGEKPGRVTALGFTFVAGIIVSFVALALVVLAFRSAGAAVGWGFQSQSPVFGIGMATVVFVFGLSLFGVFEITLPGRTATKLAGAESHEGFLGAFMKGLLGTVLATPCTAPLMGPAIGWAWTSSSDRLIAVFATIGLGMASPFIVLSLRPRWLRFLPRPGKWMERFKQLMGFFLMGTVIWLLWPLGTLIGPKGLIWVLVFLTFVGIGAWLIGLQSALTPTARRLSLWAAALGITWFGWWFSFGGVAQIQAMAQDYQQQSNPICELTIPGERDFDKKIPWQRWSKGLGERLASEGYTVYVDYTAEWCATCLVNKRLTLESEAVRGKMQELCVIPLKADNTHYDPAILDDLQKFQRAGVPLNVIYPANKPNEPILLPEQLVGRSSFVIAQLESAGASRTCREQTPLSATN